MKKNWNKEKDKFNKKLNNIFFVIYVKKKIYIWRKIEIEKRTNLIRNKTIYLLQFSLKKNNW